MIHLLKVSPKLSIKELKKLSRRYAMTGGYELALEEDLSPAELEELAEQQLPELAGYKPGTARYRSNNAYRILDLIVKDPKTSPELREKIRKSTGAA